MLRQARKLEHYTLEATDGDLGKVKDFYYSDIDWVVRYLVADTGHWLPGRRVLLSPDVFDEPLWLTTTFPVKLTRQQVNDSPEVEEHIPISRRHELDLMAHYDWPVYWEMAANPYIPPVVVPNVPVTSAGEEGSGEGGAEADTHLRSVNDIRGYRIHATDGEDVGAVEDVAVEDGTWAIRYMIVDIGRFITKKKVIISPQWISGIELSGEAITLDLESDRIINSPHWDTIAPIEREYEKLLFEYYARPKYWV